MAPLTTLLKKDDFKWNEEVVACFAKMKTLLTSTPILEALDFSKTFVLECDALGMRLGVILMQDNHPSAFESQILKLKDKTRSTYDKEMLAIMHAFVKWKQYLLGINILMKTYHNSLKYFLTQKKLLSEQQKWVSKLQVFDFDILYKKGRENLVSNVLSRNYDSHATLFVISCSHL